MSRALAVALVCSLLGFAGLLLHDLRLQREWSGMAVRLATAEQHRAGAAAFRELREEWWEEGAPDLEETPPSSPSLGEALRARSERLEQALADTRRQLAQWQEMAPRMEGCTDAAGLAARLDELEAMSEAQRFQAVWVLGGWLGGAPERTAVALRFLVEETVVARLRRFSEVVRAGGLRTLDRDRDGVVAVCTMIEHGVPAERRIAAAWAIQPARWHRAYPEWAERIGAALVHETDADVLNAITGALGGEAVELGEGLRRSLAQAAESQPEGELRSQMKALSVSPDAESPSTSSPGDKRR